MKFRCVGSILPALLVPLFLSPAIGKGDSAPTPTTTPQPNSPPNSQHVIVVVWDGMRPDLLSEQNCPTLWKLSRDGVTFGQHHSVYPTATNINGAALATGAYPNRNTLLANREYRPRIDLKRPFENADIEVMKKGDEVAGGKYLALPTIAETLRAAGRSAAIVGAKSAAFLQDRHAEWVSAASIDSVTRFAAAPMPASLREETIRLLGPFPNASFITSEQRNVYATRTLTELLWRDEVPAFSFLWLSDPDLTQHQYSPGAKQSMAAIRNSDRNLATILDSLSEKNARTNTDIFVVSDHGFSTIERAIDFPETLRAAGFDAHSEFERAPKPGQIMVAENGATILFYVIEHQRPVVSRLIDWLQHSDFAGVIFSREKIEGTFPLESIRANTSEAPDVMVALRWNAKANQFGIPGHIIADNARKAGDGSHASLSKFDVHNVLIAEGPHFRRGFTSDLPSGNIDLAPTILHLFGVEPPRSFDGRILAESLTGDAKSSRPATETLEATRKFDSGIWHQHLQITRVGETIYFDEGNGAFEKQR